MARKQVKREVTQVAVRPISVTADVQSLDNRHQPTSSGITTSDSDMTIQEDQQDENSQPSRNHFTNAQRKAHPDHVINPDSGIHVLGRGVKELVQAVQELRHLGVEDLNLPLPKIVVVGDQSTGKSSLIEGMSEIKVPRKADTCTRCPLEINLTESSTGSWNCNVSLFKKYIYEGNLGTTYPHGKGFTKSEGATRARPLGPWTVQDAEDFHFATVTSKSDVPDALHRAQLATLNPGSPYEKYMPGKSAPSNHQVKFSPNIVRLDISGPDLPNLSFYDLPGVINVPDIAGEEYLVTLVKNLVKSYVSTDDSINLLAIPMSDDPANSSASQLIREAKAEPRTVGCVTKPDRRQIGEPLDQWIQILNGKRFHLGHGYYVIKNNPDPSVDHAVARAEEVAFFEGHEPWTTILKDHNTRFGTLPLQTALSQLLTAQIRKSLPRITAQVQLKAEMIDASLKELPEPLHGNLPAIVLGELMKFEKVLQKNIDGGSRDYPFLKAWNEKAMHFRKVLADTKPVMVLPFQSRVLQQPSMPDTPSSSTQETPTPTSRVTAAIAIDSDDEDLPTEPTPTPRSAAKRAHPSTQTTPIKSRRSTNTTPRSAPVSVKVQSKRFVLSEVRSIIQDAYVGDIPEQIHPKAIEEMIVLSMAHWQEPLDQFLKETQGLCEGMVFEQVEAVFGHRQNTRYFDLILEICQTFFEEAFSQQRQLLKRILTWEMSKPKTLNEEAMGLARDKALTMLQAYSRELRAHEYIEEQESRSGKPSSGAARRDKVAKVTDGQLKPEMHGREILAMSVVKGFYEVAYSRFVDIVCSSIHCELFGKCRDELFPVMTDKFGVTEPGANERFAVLLAANARDEERRVVLMKEKATIEKAQERLEANMADEGAPEQLANLHLDEVTGERVSKSELKKRNKQRELEERKAKKATETPAKAPNPLAAAQKKKPEEEAELTPNQYHEIRSREIRQRQLDGLNPYPHKFHAVTDLREFLEQHADIKTGESRPEVEVRLGGRIFVKRSSGSKLVFYDIKDEGASVQVLCQLQQMGEDAAAFEKMHEHIRRGDIVGIVGYPGRTAPRSRDEGELSIFATKLLLLAPCLHQIPSAHYGYKDPEQRYRNRFIDWSMNDKSRQVAVQRDLIIRYVRRYFWGLDFHEPETPILSAIAGGATARPFETYHNDLKRYLFMRVAPELYLKKMIGGGFNRVFEIGKQFRNEGIDPTHNPEFTTCEFYWAYKDYNDIMDITEDLVSGLAKNVTGGYVTKYHTLGGQEYTINWEKPWKRVDIIPTLEERCREKFPPGDQFHTEETNTFLKRILEKCKVECTPPLTNTRMFDALIGEFLELDCIQPTFLMNHPQVMSPLAKAHRSRPGLCERFEAFVCTKEIANAYTELNDPFDQRLRFEEQAAQKAQGDEEAQLVDENFCTMLEYGMPPTGGWGMGIDRLVMFMTDNNTIKEVILFPFMKEETNHGKEKKPVAEELGVDPQPAEEAPRR